MKKTYLFLALILTACGVNPKPMGLVETTAEYAPVVRVSGGNGTCTGTFVSPRAVLTAAHCTLRTGPYTVASSFGNFGTVDKTALGNGTVSDTSDLALLVFPSDVASRELGQVYDIGQTPSVGSRLRLVGFGCDNPETKRGAGIKRTGTNVIDELGEFLVFYSPIPAGARSRLIGGFGNYAYSCFGDSGGPALLEDANGASIVGVTHAGGRDGDMQVSEYARLDRAENLNWLRSVNASKGLGIKGL